jgi:hypothetical protein
MTLFCSSRVAVKVASLCRAAQGKKPGFCFSHQNLSATQYNARPSRAIDRDVDYQIQEAMAFDFTEPYIFRCRRSALRGFQLPSDGLQQRRWHRPRLDASAILPTG